MRPGEVLVPVVRGDAGELWRLVPDAPDRTDGRVPLTLDGAKAIQRARLLVPMQLPAIARPATLQGKERWSAKYVAKCNPRLKVSESLSGRSLELGCALAVASLMLDQALQEGLAASASVGEGGNLEPVDGVAAKAAALRLARTPGPVLVAREQQARWEEELPGFAVLGCGSLSEALDKALPGVLEGLRARWTGAHACEAAAGLFELVLGPRPLLLSWLGVARAATIAEEACATPEGRWRARIARQIAGRHASRAELLDLDHPSFEALPWPRQVRLLAHAVQAVADTASDDPSTLSRAEEALSSSLDYPADLELRGSLGRLLASLHRFDEAIGHLERATQCWFDLGQVPDASFSLSEWLRVLGVTGDPETLDRAIDRYVERALGDPRCGPDSACFLRFAAGRALLQQGRDPGPWLMEGPWASAPVHLRASRLRWIGHHEALEQLAADRPREAGFAWDLACLDRALAAGEPPDGPIRQLAARGGSPLAEIRRMERLGLDATGIAHHFRY